jgi:GT2 family glycosyltransferase
MAVRLSALVVAFRKEELLQACLASVDDALARVDGETELVVVLNDGSAATRARLATTVTVEGDPGLGFAGAVASGLAAARGEWIALVNDDCSLHPDALAELLDAGSRDPGVGSVAAQVLFAARRETINSAGIEVDDLGVARERRLGEPADAADPDVVEVFGASAACCLYRRAMLDDVGGLDTSFFAYLEDADLAWRARMAGWRCVLAPRALAFHEHSATLGHGSRQKYRLVGRNRVRMLAKNAATRQLRRRLIRIVAYDLLYVAYAGMRGRTLAPLAGRLEGLRDWSEYREAGRPSRRETPLRPSPGVLHALGRSRVYRAASPAPGPRQVSAGSGLAREAP